MCIGYDPFKWADSDLWTEEDEKEEFMKEIGIDLDAIAARRDELADLKARYTFELKQVEKEIETLDLQLIALLNQTGVDSMDWGTYTFGWKTTNRTALDQKYLKENFADIAAKCTFTKENRVFNFKINNGG